MGRVVRGMMPHKCSRGAKALEKLACFVGVPSPYDKVKSMIVPCALKVLRMARDRAVTKLGRLSSSVGWKHEATVKDLETKRKEKASVYFDRKQKLTMLS